MRHVQPNLSLAKDTTNNAAAQIQINTSFAKGAKPRRSGGWHVLGGTYLQSIVLVELTRAIQIVNAEICGLVAGLFRFETELQIFTLFKASNNRVLVGRDQGMVRRNTQKRSMSALAEYHCSGQKFRAMNWP